MKFFRLDLLTLLISLFILGSCKNQNDIGLPGNDQQISGTLVVDDNIIVNTVEEEPVITTGSGKIPLASFNDNVLGETNSSIAASIGLPGDTSNTGTGVSYTLPTGVITTDSAILELPYNDGFYGDSLTSKYNISVQQLTEKPSAVQAYYSNKVWGHEEGVIGSRQAFNVRPKTRVKVTDIVKGAADTVRSNVPHIRVPISTAFINEKFFGASAAQLANSIVYQNAIKGLYLTLQRSQSSQAGGVVMLNLNAGRIKVYYRTNNSGTLDTSMVALPIVTSAYAANITHNYTPAVKSTIVKDDDNITQSSDVFYLHGGSLRAKVSFPNLEKLFGTTDVSKVVLNRAELVITPEANTTVPYVPLPQLTLYRLDIAKQRIVLPDANGSSQGALDAYYFSTAIFGGRYDQTKQQYRFVITGYIQRLLDKKLTDYGTYIAPIDTAFLVTSPIPITSTIATAARTIATGSKASSANRIKLNIIYNTTK
ncbi:DUF4270 family protein [Mucilaginibacter lacusdianchii]|uniref:DUF4270 family protein n=1 Tax=Mucilaginibacter lacusdianchii TaxID=2684211 RepID=UPI00131C7F6A|nr:DUF4270 family protein [Mucilaginibacter sp. JXJ CY 39]